MLKVHMTHFCSIVRKNLIHAHEKQNKWSFPRLGKFSNSLKNMANILCYLCYGKFFENRSKSLALN